MRLAYLVLVSLVGCTDPADTGTTTDQVYAGEILHNGGFEMLDSTGWIAGWDNMDTNPNGVIAVVSDPVRFGEYAVQWQIEAAGDGREYWFTQNIDGPLIQANQTYELTGWFMSDHVDDDVAFNYFVRGEPGDSPDISTLSWPAMGPTVANVWQHFAYDITIPDGAPATWEVALHSIKFSGQPELLTVDAVSLHPKLF
jgi:hypothetical protein